MILKAILHWIAVLFFLGASFLFIEAIFKANLNLLFLPVFPILVAVIALTANPVNKTVNTLKSIVLVLLAIVFAPIITVLGVSMFVPEFGVAAFALIPIFFFGVPAIGISVLALIISELAAPIFLRSSHTVH